MNRGVPPTDPKARTGELTPPGMHAFARRERASSPVVDRWRTAAPRRSLMRASVVVDGGRPGRALVAPVSQPASSGAQ